MGFWARDKADQEDRTPPGYQGRPAPPMRPIWTCEDCRREFLEKNGYLNHRFDGHTVVRPVLTLLDRELDRGRPVVPEPHESSAWAVANASGVVLNGKWVEPASLGQRLSSMTTGVISIRLIGDRVATDYEITFDIADPAELDEIDAEFINLAYGEKLTVTAIAVLIDRHRHLETAGRYLGGLTDYLYGVLVRDGSLDSGLEPEQYRDKYEAAAAALLPYRRPMADTIVGLIAFHFNQFDEARARSGGHRVAAASRRLRGLELGHELIDVDAVTEGDLDFVLSDSKTEQLLGWSCASKSELEATLVDELEAGLTAHDPLDQRKLRLLAAECRLCRGEAKQLRHHVTAVRGAGTKGEWVTRMMRELEALESNEPRYRPNR